jgi:hypothetical protein
MHSNGLTSAAFLVAASDHESTERCCCKPKAPAATRHRDLSFVKTSKVCTVAILVFERPEFDALVKVPPIKSIGFDIFGDGYDFVNYDSSGLRDQIGELDGMIKAARAAGKSLHIAELGRPIWDFMDLMKTSGVERNRPALPRLRHRRSAVL